MCNPAPGTPPSRHDAAHRARSETDRALAERLLSDAKAGRDVRAFKVGRVRAAIEAGAYENDLKLEVALDRLRDAAREEPALWQSELEQSGPGADVPDPHGDGRDGA
jgi:hypothetical protein